MSAKYDSIGIDYNSTRRADKYLLRRIYHNLDPEKGGIYLDIGCGTGNYTNGLKKIGVKIIGIDPSETMLATAKEMHNSIHWQLGTAENTGLESSGIDGVIATLTIHHWPDLDAGFREMYRVLKKQGRILIFTSTPEQMKGYWLNYYFPEMLRHSMKQMPTLSQVTKALNGAGIMVDRFEKYSVKPDLEDLFLYSGKHNPELYFDAEVRRGISSFSSLANAEEVEEGLMKLKNDINSGKVKDVMKSFENDEGDYLFIVGHKA